MKKTKKTHYVAALCRPESDCCYQLDVKWKITRNKNKKIETKLGNKTSNTLKLRAKIISVSLLYAILFISKYFGLVI